MLEVWYHGLETMRILSLRDGTYAANDYGPAFPLIPVDDLNRFASLVHTSDTMTILRKFRVWLESLRPTVVG